MCKRLDWCFVCVHHCMSHLCFGAKSCLLLQDTHVWSHGCFAASRDVKNFWNNSKKKSKSSWRILYGRWFNMVDLLVWNGDHRFAISKKDWGMVQLELEEDVTLACKNAWNERASRSILTSCCSKTCFASAWWMSLGWDMNLRASGWLASGKLPPRLLWSGMNSFQVSGCRKMSVKTG